MGNAAQKISAKEKARFRKEYNLGQADLKRLTEDFKNVSKEGFIQRQAFIELMRVSAQDEAAKFGKEMESPEHLDQVYTRLFDAFDKDGNGIMDLREYLVVYAVLQRGTPEQKAEACFKAYDLNDDGYLSRDEIRSLLQMVWKAFQVEELDTSDEEDALDALEDILEEIFYRLDVDGNDKLDLTEFKDGCRNQPDIIAYLNVLGDERSRSDLNLLKNSSSGSIAPAASSK